jgi:hypothetical protein
VSRKIVVGQPELLPENPIFNHELGKSILIDMETFTRGLMDVYMPQSEEDKMKLLFRM